MTGTPLYDTIGTGYSFGRRTDPDWMAAIETALGGAASIVNIGAGTGSYEPARRTVLAVEPSSEMIRQRPAGSAPAVRAFAQSLPLRDDCADTALAVHHWTDWRRGLAELRRVADRQVVLAYDTARHTEFWFVREHVPEIARLEPGGPSAPDIAAELNASTVIELPLRWDFTDGVFPANWRRPETFLDPRVRAACSALAQTDPAAIERGVRALRADLESGRWHERHRDLLEQDRWTRAFG